MKKYRLKYYYLDQGMEGNPHEYPEKIIEAENEERAYYEYHKFCGFISGTFEDFMAQNEYARHFATSCKEITKVDGSEEFYDLVRLILKAHGCADSIAWATAKDAAILLISNYDISLKKKA